MKRRPTTPHLATLYTAARARPIRGIAAAALITGGGILLGIAERLIDLPEGAVIAAAAEQARNRKENPS